MTVTPIDARTGVYILEEVVAGLSLLVESRAGRGA